jgi:hypothetical protein
MMMAPDRTPHGPELSAESLAALELALQSFVARDDAVALQPALQRIAAEAREKQMHAEQLLIVLKDVWFGLPEIAQAAHGDAQNRLLQRVVTLCIREYYSAP